MRWNLPMYVSTVRGGHVLACGGVPTAKDEEYRSRRLFVRGTRMGTQLDPQSSKNNGDPYDVAGALGQCMKKLGPRCARAASLSVSLSIQMQSLTNCKRVCAGVEPWSAGAHNSFVDRCLNGQKQCNSKYEKSACCESQAILQPSSKPIRR
jgi:hypothetical protein